MANFLHKKSWDDKEWDIYYNNIELLRNRANLNKSEFNLYYYLYCHLFWVYFFCIPKIIK